jgi:protease-4
MMLDAAWQRAACGWSNLRRAILRKRLPAYVVIEVAGDLLERAPDVPWYYRFVPIYEEPLSLEEIAAVLRRVAGDPDLQGVVVLFKGAGLSLPQAQSLAALFARFRRWDAAYNGKASRPPKKVVAYLEDVSAPTYVAAAGADRIVMAPLADWDVTGLRVEPIFLKDALARLGIQVDVVRVAPWKTAADSVLFSGLTDAARDQYNWLLDSLYQDILQAIVAGRGLDQEEAATLVDRAPLTAAEALAAKLVDHVAYEDELVELLGASEHRRPLATYRQARKLLYRHPLPVMPQAVGVISLTGSIMTGESRSVPIPVPIFGNETIGSATAQQLIRQARRDDSLDAVILHVDSPGGSALASDLIWRELTLLNQEKPLVVYMGDVAASGGYYISAPGQKIVAQRATLTGSIGVIAAKVVTTGALEKLSVYTDSVERGANAGIYSSAAPWQGLQRQRVEDSIAATYQAFKERVGAGRSLASAAVDDVAGGRVWTGAQAKEHGLVDEVGDFQVAVELACAAAGLPVDAADTIPVVPVAMPKRTLLAESAQEVLGLAGVRRFALLADLALDGEFGRQLRREHVWLLADPLLRI